MENSIYIYHHLGMGDHILCNAIIRNYAEKYEKVFLFAKPGYVNNVIYMYRDNPRIKMIAMDDAQVKSFMRFNPNNNYLVVGITPQWFKRLDVDKEFETFDHGFYVAADVSFDDKWNKFYFERDIEKEKQAFYSIFNLKDNEEYAFVHDDPKRNRIFDSKYLPKGITLIRPVDYPNVGLFDFIYTIENAKETHVMNSSFSCLIDTMLLKTNSLFLHQYARNDMGSNPNHKLKLNWTILK
jgi:hypothetical protein